MSPSPFLLPPLPHSASEDKWGSFGMPEFQATALVSNLSGMLQVSARADLFWQTGLLQEARSSSAIEGIRATLDEILEAHAGRAVPVERQDDVQDVLNCSEALQTGLEEVGRGRPLTLSLVRALHAQLLQGARGARKTPGQWRQRQVYIGAPGAGPHAASFVPPDPVHVQPLLENWEQFLQRKDLNPLIQAAVMHAQFEMIHPFLDGNGRMGRILIALLFLDKKVLTRPCFFMSAYFQHHQQTYYELLGNVSKHGDWRAWIDFFLQAVAEQGRDTIALFTSLNRLYDESGEAFCASTRSSHALSVLDCLFQKPLFTLPDLQKQLSGRKLSHQSLVNILNRLEQSGHIERIAPGRGRTPALWRFRALMALLASDALRHSPPHR